MDYKSRVFKLPALILCLLAATSFLASYPKEINLDRIAWLILLPNQDGWKLLSRDPQQQLPYNRSCAGQEHCPAAIKDDGKQTRLQADSRSCPGDENCAPAAAVKDDRKQPQPVDVGDACPFYFNYIYEDLEPWSVEDASAAPNNRSPVVAADQLWKNGTTTADHHPGSDRPRPDRAGGISKEMLDNATRLADFRVVIKKGRMYVQTYRACFQTRGSFTIWGLLQLLRLYPGLVPDVDFLFGCGDAPHVHRGKYEGSPPPPVFRYCTTPNHFDIPFPDWSFWGWPEVDLRPWHHELTDIQRGADDLHWERRQPTAFWKGNTRTGGKLRRDLLSCNGDRYGAQILHQDWRAAARSNYADSRLAQQCKNRYKIYAEGQAWSVSLKYILACDSPGLVIDPVFHDFFSRGLMPMEHFWPVCRNKLCNSIKFAVEWGNHKPRQAETLGKLGRQFISTEVSMDRVYDYMFHALQEYAKLLRFEPTAGEKMREVTAEGMAQKASEGKIRAMYEESMVKEASRRPPCLLQSPAARSDHQKLMEGRQAQKMSITGALREAEEAGNWEAANILIRGPVPS